VALTTIPAAGAKLRGATLSDLITEVRAVSAYKSANESVSSATTGNTYQNDDELFVSVVANATYRAHLHIVFSSGTTPDFKVTGTVPTGATASAWSWLAAGANSDAALTTGIVVAGTGSNEPVDGWGTVITSSTAGTVQIQWAQSVSDAGSTTVVAGSFLVLERLS
jgi:hypothetical protein